MRWNQMTNTPHLGSILIGSADPGRLCHWYCRVFGAELEQGGTVRFGGVELHFETRSDVAVTNPEPDLHCELPRPGRPRHLCPSGRSPCHLTGRS